MLYVSYVHYIMCKDEKIGASGIPGSGPLILLGRSPVTSMSMIPMICTDMYNTYVPMYLY